MKWTTRFDYRRLPKPVRTEGVRGLCQFAARLRDAFPDVAASDPVAVALLAPHPAADSLTLLKDMQRALMRRYRKPGRPRHPDRRDEAWQLLRCHGWKAAMTVVNSSLRLQDHLATANVDGLGKCRHFMLELFDRAAVAALNPPALVESFAALAAAGPADCIQLVTALHRVAEDAALLPFLDLQDDEVEGRDLDLEPEPEPHEAGEDGEATPAEPVVVIETPPPPEGQPQPQASSCVRQRWRLDDTVHLDDSTDGT